MSPEMKAMSTQIKGTLPVLNLSVAPSLDADCNVAMLAFGRWVASQSIIGSAHIELFNSGMTG